MIACVRIQTLEGGLNGPVPGAFNDSSMYSPNRFHVRGAEEASIGVLQQIQVAMVEVCADGFCVASLVDQAHGRLECASLLDAEKLAPAASIEADIAESPVLGLRLQQEHGVVAERLPRVRERLLGGLLCAVGGMLPVNLERRRAISGQ